MLAAAETSTAGEIVISKDLTLPKLLVQQCRKFGAKKGRHAGEGVWHLASCDLGAVS